MGNTRPGWAFTKNPRTEPEPNAPARHGFWWNPAEEKDMVRLHKRGFSIKQIAERHQRTTIAVHMRLDLITSGVVKPVDWYRLQPHAREQALTT